MKVTLRFQIIKKKSEDYFRLRYLLDGTQVTTQGFITMRQLCTVLLECRDIERCLDNEVGEDK